MKAVNSLRTAIIAASLLAVACLVVIQIVTANTATKLEIALFNVLQFVFSLVFAWQLSDVASEKRFQDAQRRFAMAAFRRIKEIERSLVRLKSYVSPKKATTRDELRETISIIRVGLESAQDNVRSSVADWSDIIGDEIQVANEVSRLKILREEIEGAESKIVDGRLTQELSDRIESVDKKIEELTRTLPAEMRGAVEDEISVDMDELVSALRSEWRKTGKLTLRANWDSSDSYQGDLSEMRSGDHVQLGRGSTKSRDDVVLLFNAQHKKVAVILNDLSEEGCDYDTFRRVLLDLFGTSLLLDEGEGLTAIIKEIKPRVVQEPDEEDKDAGRLETQQCTVEISSGLNADGSIIR